MPTDCRLLEGTVVAGHYRLEALIGSGTSSAVFRATDLYNQRTRAVKVCTPDVALSPALARVLRHGQRSSRFERPYIVPILHHAFAENGNLLLVMPFMACESVARLLSRPSRVDAATAVTIAEQAATGIFLLHSAGIAHGHLRPSSVLLEHLPDGGVVAKIHDYGLTRRALAASGAMSGNTDRTVDEMLRGGAGDAADPSPTDAADPSRSTDVPSLGRILYALLSQRDPFMTEELPSASRTCPSLPRLLEVAPSLDPSLARIIDRAIGLTKTPFPSARAFLEALRPFAAHGGCIALDRSQCPERDSSADGVEAAFFAAAERNRLTDADSLSISRSIRADIPPPNARPSSGLVRSWILGTAVGVTAAVGVLNLVFHLRFARPIPIATLAPVIVRMAARPLATEANSPGLPRPSAPMAEPSSRPVAARTVARFPTDAAVAASAAAMGSVDAAGPARPPPIKATMSRPAATLPSRDCAIPYTIDPAGIRHIKRHCL